MNINQYKNHLSQIYDVNRSDEPSARLMNLPKQRAGEKKSKIKIKKAGAESGRVKLIDDY